MQKTPQLSVTLSSTFASISGSAKRRSTRIPGRSEEQVTSPDIGNAMGYNASTKNVDETNSSGSSSTSREGWKHPAELQYIRRADWSQDLMITYLCQKAFTVPPRQVNTTLSYTEITRSFSGEKIHIPRGYRIPLMFVAKFQWESLRLVLNNASEWEEYKFDIIHLSRLCTHFFKQAKSAASENKLTKSWRSPMFDRALIRFYRKWMVSREWSVKKFWEEYDEDEYKLDVLKFDWSRWVLKGHKGFFLTKEEVQNGITADQYTDGLKRKPDGKWVWGGDDSSAKDASSLDALNSLASQDAVEAITNAMSSHDSIEVKQELLEIDDEGEVVNSNGKRQRFEDGDSPPKTPARVSKKSRRHKISARKKKAAAIATPVFRAVSPNSSGGERQGKEHEEDTAMVEDPAPPSFSLTNAVKIHGRKHRVLLTDKSRKSSPSTTTTMVVSQIDIPIDEQPDLLISATTSTGDLALSQAPEMVSTQLEDVVSAVLPVPTAENMDDRIAHESPLLDASEAPIRYEHPILKTIPVPWPTRSLSIAVSAQSECGSSSLAPGNSDNGQESNPTSAATPIDPSMQTDPDIVPNAEASDPSTAAVIDLIVDAFLPQSSITLPVTTPPPSSGTPNPNMSSDSSSFHLSPNIHQGAHVPENPPYYCADISNDSNGPNHFDSVVADRDLTSCVPGLKDDNLIQRFLDTIQRMAVAPRIEEPQITPETITAEGTGLMETGDSIDIPLSPVLSQLVYPADFTSGADEVEEIVAGTQSAVEEVEAEENGTGNEVTSTEDSAPIVPAGSGSDEVKEGGKDVVGEPEVVDTTDDLVEDTNGLDARMDKLEKCAVEVQSRQETPTMHDIDRLDLRMEKGAVEVQPVQSRQTPTMHNIDGLDVAMKTDGVEVQPVHTQLRQQTPSRNGTDEGGIVLEIGAVEGQSLNSQSSTETPTTPLNDSQTPHHSAVEGVPSHTEYQGGDSQEVKITHAGGSEDNMNVDEEIIRPIQPTPPVSTDGSSATSTHLVPTAVRTKSLHSIQLLQGLIHFLQTPVRDTQLRMSRLLQDDLAILKSQGTCPAVEQDHYPLLAGPCLVTEEAISVDQRLDALAHVSITLAKNLYPYRGKELETKIDLLDKSLQQQFEMIQKLDGRSCGEMDGPFKELGAHPDAEFDRNTVSTSIETISQSVPTSLILLVDRQFKSVEVQTEDENELPASQRSLSPDATMIDLTIHTPPVQESPSTPAAKGEQEADNNRSVATTVMSMMRNMADLLECATQESSRGSVRSLKGKEKEVIGADMVPSYLNSSALTTILEEFKAMKEEMRRSQQRSQSEVESMKLSHFMELEALKDEIRNIESRGKRELDEVTRRYTEQIEELKATIRLREERERVRDRDKDSGSESKDLLDIRRRVASLEARSRSDSISVDLLRSNSRSSITNGHFSEPANTRHPNFNPPHFSPTDFEEQPYTAFRAPRQYMRDGSMSKPGTPAPSDRHAFSSRHSEVMDVDESMPLPAKSQRKMHMMNFTRPPMG